MTTHALKDLIAKIRQALTGECSRSELIALADDYARNCREIGQRLSRISALLEKDEIYSALKLAEEEPALLEFVEELDSEMDREWRSLCTEQRFSVAEPVDVSTLQRLQDLCRSGNLDAAYFYRDYRSAMLQKDKVAALQALRLIVRIQPADQNAKEELQRIQQRYVQSRLKDLNEAMQRDQAAEVLAIMDELQGLISGDIEQHDTWKKALGIREELRGRKRLLRCEELVREIRGLAAVQDDQGVVDCKKQWDRLVYFEGAEVRDTERQEVEKLAAKAQQKLDEESQLRHQEEIANQWFFFVKEIDSELRGSMSPEACRAALMKLDNFRRELLIAGAEPDDALDRDTRRTEQVLTLRLRRSKQKRQLYYAAAALAVLVAIAIGMGLYERKTHREESLGLMAEALQHRDLNQVERLLQVWRQQSTGFNHTPAIVAMREEASEWLGREKANEQQVQQLYARVRDALGLGKSQIESISRDLKEAEELWNNLLPASQENLRFMRQEVSLAWQRSKTQWVNEERLALDNLTVEFRELWDKHFKNIQYPEEAKDNLRRAQEVVAQVKLIRSRLNWMNEGAASEDDFWKKAESDLSVLEDQFANYELAQQRLRENSSLDSFRFAVATLAGLPFDSSNLVTAARNVSRTENQWEEPSKALLQLGEDHGLPEGSRADGNLRFYPSRLVSSENLQLRSLYDHPVISRLNRYDVHNYRSGALLRDTEVVYSMGEIESETNPHGDREEVVQVVRLVTANTLKKNPYYEEMVFMATRRLHDKTWRDGSALVNGGPVPELAFLELLRNKMDYQKDSGQIGRSVLHALDELFSHSEVDPVFRAWVYGELIQVALNRPEEWGVLVAPALLRDWERLQRLFDGVPALTDWLDPNRSALLRPVVQAFFQNPSVPSYVRQATFQVYLSNMLSLSRWNYYGYVSLDGKIVATAEVPEKGRFLWGLEAFRGRWVALFENQAGNWNNKAAPQALTPLFVLSEDLAGLVIDAAAKAGVKEDSELQALREYLPVYFR